MFDPDDQLAAVVGGPRPSPSHVRYNYRRITFQTDKCPLPELRHDIHWFLHNIVVHPLLGLLPGRATTLLHNVSSHGLNHGYGRSSPVPVVENQRAWRYHNVVAHILIGLVPCEETFRLHDRTAREMKVEGWV